MNPDLTNQTNLALKGVVGIGAMGKISAAMGQAEDQDNFTVCISSSVNLLTSDLHPFDAVIPNRPYLRSMLQSGYRWLCRQPVYPSRRLAHRTRG